MLRERHEQYLLQILKIDKFGNYSVVDPLNYFSYRKRYIGLRLSACLVNKTQATEEAFCIFSNLA